MHTIPSTAERRERERLSHELRTPLNSILGFAQVLAGADLSAPDRDAVQHILTAGRQMLGLIEAGLDGARVEPGSILRAEHGAAEAPAAVPGRAPARILYVEDNLSNLSLVEFLLARRPGWTILPALQGRLGVELAREHRPDLVLLDLRLPDIPGEEVLRRLRADARTARIPVLIVSADATPAQAEQLRVEGADTCLAKPLDVKEFLLTVERLLAGVARA